MNWLPRAEKWGAEVPIEGENKAKDEKEKPEAQAQPSTLSKLFSFKSTSEVVKSHRKVSQQPPKKAPKSAKS